jgi:FkbM family methyltransferase
MMLDLQKLLNKYNLKPKGVIQIGSHYFQEKEVFQKVGIERFVLIEPQAQAFSVTKQNANDLHDCILYNCAISDTEGTMTLFCDTSNEGQSSSLLKAERHIEIYPSIVFDREEQVEVKKLDNLDFEKTKYDLLVIDVQGNELRVLQSGLVTLQNINVVYLEVNFEKMYSDCCLVTDLDEFFSLHGFTRTDTGADAGGWSDAMYVRNELLIGIDLSNSDNEYDSELFNELDYLELYPDVAEAVSNGFFRDGKHHYSQFGMNEGRKSYIKKGEPRINRAYVIEVPEELAIADREPYPIGSNLEFERYFSEQFIEQNPQGLTRKLLPIAWTAYYKAFKTNPTKMASLQTYLHSLDKSQKYFTICNYNEGILSDISMLDIIVYAGAKYKPEYYPIPLIHDSEDVLINGSAKTDLFSFVGSYTNDIRVELKKLYPQNVTLGFNRQEFIKQINTSLFTLCPIGAADSTFRIFEALMCGSIPVYIANNHIEPFNLPFENYGVKFYAENIDSIMDALYNIGDSHVTALQENGRTYFSKYFTYEGCFESIIQTLTVDKHAK